MSAISTIYDLLETTVTTALPNHMELINPYFPETDSELTYNASFGLAIAEGSNLLLNDGSGLESRQRNFILSLTRRIFATKGDVSSRKTTEKNLMEDYTLVADAIAESRELQSSSLVSRVFYNSDSGIEFLRADNNRVDILIFRVVISVEYTQPVIVCF